MREVMTYFFSRRMHQGTYSGLKLSEEFMTTGPFPFNSRAMEVTLRLEGQALLVREVMMYFFSRRMHQVTYSGLKLSEELITKEPLPFNRRAMEVT